MRRWPFLLLLTLLLPAVAWGQITDKTQTSLPFGLNAAAASGAACVYPPSAVASCVRLDYQGYQGVAALLKGTWAGTVVGEVSADGGTTWTSVNLVSSAGVSAASVTAAGLYNPSLVAGAQIFQVRVSVYTSGSVDVVLRGTSAQARGTPSGGGFPVGGTGTAGTIPKWSAPTTLTDSLLTDTGAIVSLTSGSFRLYGSATVFSELTTSSAGALTLDQATAKSAAPTAALAGAGAGNVDNGTHVYCVTFITAGGETDCSTSSAAVTVTDKTVDGQVTVTIATSAFSGVTGRNIYRSTAGTTTPLKLVAASPVVANNTATTYTDNIADASLQVTTAPTANTTDDARVTVANTGNATFVGSVTAPRFVIGAAANTVPFTSTGYSVTGSGTSAHTSVAGTLNTSGVTHVNDWSITNTASGAGSTAFRIRTGAAGATANLSVDMSGNLVMNGNVSTGNKLRSAGTAPTVGNIGADSCGTSPATITGTDVAGKVTVGATAGTACRVTFASAWASAPACTVTNETTANLSRATSTTAQVDLAGTFVAGDVLAYICIGGS